MAMCLLRPVSMPFKLSLRLTRNRMVMRRILCCGRQTWYCLWLVFEPTKRFILIVFVCSFFCSAPFAFPLSFCPRASGKCFLFFLAFFSALPVWLLHFDPRHQRVFLHISLARTEPIFDRGKLDLAILFVVTVLGGSLKSQQAQLGINVSEMWLQLRKLFDRERHTAR